MVVRIWFIPLFIVLSLVVINDFNNIMTLKAIKISEVTKVKLKSLNGKTYDDSITLMLDYFAHTGINPNSKVGSASTEIKNETERMIKILRAFEKTYFHKITNTEEMVKILSKSSPLLASNTNDIQTENKEMLAVISENEQLKKNYELLLQQQNNEVHKEQINVLNMIPKEVVKNKVDSLITVLKELQESTTTSNIESGKYMISQNLFNQKIRFINAELKSFL